jgi:hypothetical protein
LLNDDSDIHFFFLLWHRLRALALRCAIANVMLVDRVVDEELEAFLSAAPMPCSFCIARMLRFGAKSVLAGCWPTRHSPLRNHSRSGAYGHGMQTRVGRDAG